jgi:hypothetical protein
MVGEAGTQGGEVKFSDPLMADYCESILPGRPL